MTQLAVFLLILAQAFALACYLRPGTVALVRRWWVEMAFTVAVLLAPGPLYGKLVSVALLGAACLAAQSSYAETLSAKSDIAGSLIGGAAWVWSVLEQRSIRRRFWRGQVALKLPPARIRKLERCPVGWRLEFTCKPGWTPGHIAKGAANLASRFRARQVRVYRDGEDARQGVAYIVKRDPLAELAGVTWPGAPRSLWKPVPLGMDEFGVPVTLSLPERNVFLSGEPGAGKTATMQMLVAAAAADPGTTLLICDGKEVDLPMWREHCAGFAGADTQEAQAVLGRAAQWMSASYDRLRAEGRRKVAPGDPLLVVVVDELAYYLSSDKAFGELLRDLVQRGRGAGLIVIAATQKPDSRIIPTTLRDLFAYRLGLRCTTSASSDQALGQGWADNGCDCSTIPSGQRGTGYLLAEGDVPIRMRTYWLSDDDVDELAAARVPGYAPADPDAAELVEECEPDGPATGSGQPWPSGQAEETPEGGPATGQPGQPGQPLASRLLASDPPSSRAASPGMGASGDLAAALAEHLNGRPISRSELARRVGRSPSDGSVRRALATLQEQGRAVKTPDGWRASS